MAPPGLYPNPDRPSGLPGIPGAPPTTPQPGPPPPHIPRPAAVPYPGAPPGGWNPNSMVPGIGYPTQRSTIPNLPDWPSIGAGEQVTGPGGTSWPGMPVPLGPGGVPNPTATPFQQAWENWQMMLHPETRPDPAFYRQHYPDLSVQGPGIPPGSTIGNLGGPTGRVGPLGALGLTHPTKAEATTAGAQAVAAQEMFNTIGNVGQGIDYYSQNWPEILWNTATGVGPGLSPAGPAPPPPGPPARPPLPDWVRFPPGYDPNRPPPGPPQGYPPGTAVGP